VFKNLGKNDLVIRKVKAGWGCTAVSKADEAVKKGNSNKISVTFNTRGKKGKQGKTITVTTNDPNNQTIRLKVTGEVIPKTSTTPIKQNNSAPRKH